MVGVQYAPSHTQAGGSGPERFPAYSPIFAPKPPTKGSATPKQQRPRLDRALWPIISDRARYESLRDLAAEYGVSHETIRAIVRRAAGAHDAAGGSTTLLCADGRHARRYPHPTGGIGTRPTATTGAS